MSLGADFPYRWQHTAPAYRARVFAELQAVCVHLAAQDAQPLADLGEWPDPYLPAAMPTPRSAPHGPAVDVHLSAALKTRFLREADDMIEQALDPVRRQLRQWLYSQLQQVLEEQAAQPAAPPPPAPTA